MKYRILDHTADIMVECTGRDICECFANMAYAMFDQIVDAEKVKKKFSKDIEAEGGDDEAMLYAFLSELLFVHDCDGFVFSEFDVKIEGNRVKCRAYGEPLDLKKHHPKTEVKAVTYHMMKVDRNIPSATAVFDV